MCWHSLVLQVSSASQLQWSSNVQSKRKTEKKSVLHMKVSWPIFYFLWSQFSCELDVTAVHLIASTPDSNLPTQSASIKQLDENLLSIIILSKGDKKQWRKDKIRPTFSFPFSFSMQVKQCLIDIMNITYLSDVKYQVEVNATEKHGQ